MGRISIAGLSVAIAGLSVALLLLGPASGTAAWAAGDVNRVLVAELTGPEIDGDEPRGEFEWRGFQTRGERMRVRVRDVSLPDGTSLTFWSTCFDPDTGIPPFTRDLILDDEEVAFELRADKGDDVPRCERDGAVELRHGEAVIAAGVWCDRKTQDC